ncbi:PAS domain S-box-containing protein [Saccharicrinis carchari]|uniref:histidine kinase n=1 Tax=Saccharicrinis carchari TaxID=1168039 RepID=A0A521F936_SACCC|nr:PAS domain-containing sensor histidine kinase [Saccharicrinis carchari]SMO92574.1 PAS domain S-box-containing protein [Saccharicrinis carchari]
MDNKALSQFLSDTINGLLHTGKIEELSHELKRSIQDLESGETKSLFLSISELLAKLRDNQRFIDDLSNGKLNTEVPPNNALAAPFKQLHANLSHLVWQVQRLAEGDLNQQVDFLGNFSLYFNKLIQTLKEGRQIKQELKNSTEKYRISIENANIGIMSVSIDGIIETTNKECVNIFGYTQAELEQMPVNKFVVPDDQGLSRSYVQSALLNKDQAKGEFVKRFFHKSGKIITCQVSSSLMYDVKGQPLFFISHIKDITHRIEQDYALKKLNNKLSQTVKELKIANASKDKFFRIIAHDLRNPFHTILGLSELLLGNTEIYNYDEIKQMASNINQSTDDAYKLLENLLAWAMSQTDCIPFKPQKIVVKNIVREVISLTGSSAKAKNISMTYDIDENVIIDVDVNMISTILRNLIGNAIKFTSREGVVQISVVKNDYETRFSVKDTGIGIPTDIIDKLFKIEEKVSIPDTDSQTGTGLGLLLCKEFVEKHKGRIWVESELGKGSDFKFTISHKI